MPARDPDRSDESYSESTVPAAQVSDGDDGDVLLQEEAMECATFQEHYRPSAEFIVTSPTLDWTPDVAVNLGSRKEPYNVRMIRYRGTGDTVPLFVSDESTLTGYSEEVGYVVDDEQTFAEDEFVQPQVFSTWNAASYFEGTTRVVTAKFSPVEEDYENQVLAGEGVDRDGWVF